VVTYIELEASRGHARDDPGTACQAGRAARLARPPHALRRMLAVGRRAPLRISAPADRRCAELERRVARDGERRADVGVARERVDARDGQAVRAVEQDLDGVGGGHPAPGIVSAAHWLPPTQVNIDTRRSVGRRREPRIASTGPDAVRPPALQQYALILSLSWQAAPKRIISTTITDN
jgi:hypothetical protein